MYCPIFTEFLLKKTDSLINLSLNSGDSGNISDKGSFILLSPIQKVLKIPFVLEITSLKSNFLLQQFVDSLSNVTCISHIREYKKSA